MGTSSRGGVTLSVVTYLLGVIDLGPNQIQVVRELCRLAQLDLDSAIAVGQASAQIEVIGEVMAQEIAGSLRLAGAVVSCSPMKDADPRGMIAATIKDPRLDRNRRLPDEELVQVAADDRMPAHLAQAAEQARSQRIVSMFSSRATDSWSPPTSSIEMARLRSGTYLDRIAEVSDALRAAFEKHGATLPTFPDARPSPDVKTMSFDDWLRKARDLTQLVLAPFTTRNYRVTLANQAAALLREQPRLEGVFLGIAAEEIDRAVEPAFDEWVRALPDQWDGVLADTPRPSSHDWWRPAWQARQIRPDLDGPFHPTVSPGFAWVHGIEAAVRVGPITPSKRVFTSTAIAPPEGADGGRHIDNLPRFQIHIDLDQYGGFVSSSKLTIETATIDLLGQLPGGRVKVDIVDPRSLGDSASFLYELNEAGDRILSDSVWTTPEQLSRVLVRIEEHITFVTQKYLQGHGSLSQYNVEAGEIAEPYQLLLMFDFPAGFSRDGRYFDDEQLARLGRIAAVGRRAGVYVFVHAPGGSKADFPYLAPLVQFSNTRPDETPTHLGIPEILPLSNQTLEHDAPGAATGKAASESLAIDDFKFHWNVATWPPPSDQERKNLFAAILRDVQQTESTRVEPSTLSRLAASRQASDLARGLAVEPTVDFEDTSTWWRSQSTDHLQLSFGRMGARDVAQLQLNSALESSVLVGGRTGSGKSYLIHALIMDAVARYSPEELTVYLCDLKEGVEFKQYSDAGLPHARAIAIDSNREFAVSLLEAIDSEIAERAKLFKARVGGATVNISQYRLDTGQKWPRVMLIMDEFHKLFEQDDRLARRAMQLLERIIKEGRAFGIHTVLASQSLANVDAAFKSLAGQIPYRLVLASSDHDSRLLLGDENADAKLLTKAGEGILNAKGGARESNQRFQAAFWAPEQRQRVLEELRILADKSGFTHHPYTFEGNASVKASDYPTQMFRGNRADVLIPIGVPMSMAPPIVAKVERAPGGNVLVVDPEGQGVMMTIMTSLVAQGMDVIAIDFAALEPEWEPPLDALVGAGLRKVNRRRTLEVVDALLATVADRHHRAAYREDPMILVLLGIHRAREVDPDSFEEDSLHVKLQALAKEGPGVGVHIVGWTDRKASLDRRLGSAMLREFGQRILGRMSADDSRSLADTDQAASITPAQLVFDDFDRAITLVVRRLGFPGIDWVSEVIGTNNG